MCTYDTRRDCLAGSASGVKGSAVSCRCYEHDHQFRGSDWPSLAFRSRFLPFFTAFTTGGSFGGLGELVGLGGVRFFMHLA